MTKINKLGKSTFVIAILSFILVAVLAFGGTYAYFSAVSGKAAGKVTTGHLYLNATGEAITAINGFTADATIVQPGQLVLGNTAGDGTESGKVVTATVDSNIKYYIRVKFAVDVTTDSTTHNGVMDDKGTVDTSDDVHDDAADKGDNVGENHYEILTISVKGDKTAKGAGTPATTEWTEVMLKDGAAAADGTVRSGYFYPTFAQQTATHTGVGGGAQGTDPHTEEDWNLALLVNIADWVGAYGCDYYMEAEISIKFQVEVLQAEYLDDAKIGGGVDFGADNVISDTIELHNAWDKAVALSQPVQNP